MGKSWGGGSTYNVCCLMAMPRNVMISAIHGDAEWRKGHGERRERGLGTHTWACTFTHTHLIRLIDFHVCTSECSDMTAE